MKHIKLFEGFSDINSAAEKLWNSSSEDDRLNMLDTDDEDQYQGSGIYSKRKWDELPNNVKQTVIDLVSKKSSENYEMNLTTGDSSEEHAKAVIDAAIEAHKETEEWNLEKAVEKVMKDNELHDLDFSKSMIISSVKLILNELTKQAEAIK